MLRNPSTGGISWYHGTRASGEMLSGGLRRTEYEPEAEASGYWRAHWNALLGIHFAAHHGSADRFARPGSGVGGQAGMTRDHKTPSVIHARLSIRNPKVYASEDDMSDDAYEHEYDKRRNYTDNHQDSDQYGYATGQYFYGDSDRRNRIQRGEDEDFEDWDESEGDQPEPCYRRTQWLNLHPDKGGIVARFRDRLKAQGHDGIIYGNSEPGERVRSRRPESNMAAIAFEPEQVHVVKHHLLGDERREAAIQPRGGHVTTAAIGSLRPGQFVMPLEHVLRLPSAEGWEGHETVADVLPMKHAENQRQLAEGEPFVLDRQRRVTNGTYKAPRVNAKGQLRDGHHTLALLQAAGEQYVRMTGGWRPWHGKNEDEPDESWELTERARRGEPLGDHREAALVTPTEGTAHLYHGTTHPFAPGDVVTPAVTRGVSPNWSASDPRYAYGTPRLSDAAEWIPTHLGGGREGRVFEVEPVGPAEADPASEGAVRSSAGFRVIREVPSPQWMEARERGREEYSARVRSHKRQAAALPVVAHFDDDEEADERPWRERARSEHEPQGVTYYHKEVSPGVHRFTAEDPVMGEAGYADVRERQEPGGPHVELKELRSYYQGHGVGGQLVENVKDHFPGREIRLKPHPLDYDEDSPEVEDLEDFYGGHGFDHYRLKEGDPFSLGDWMTHHAAVASSQDEDEPDWDTCYYCQRDHDPHEHEEQQSFVPEWDQELIDVHSIHRVLPLKLRPHEHALVHDPATPPYQAARTIMDHIAREHADKGHMHWTSQKGLEHNKQAFGGLGKDTTTVVLHARTPEESDIETDPSELIEHQVHPYRRPEYEVPLGGYSPVHLTGLSWSRARDGGWGKDGRWHMGPEQPERHHEFPGGMQVEASAALPEEPYVIYHGAHHDDVPGILARGLERRSDQPTVTTSRDGASLYGHKRDWTAPKVVEIHVPRSQAGRYLGESEGGLPIEGTVHSLLEALPPSFIHAVHEASASQPRHAAWRPSAGIFAPTTGLDPVLFDGRHELRPAVREAVMDRLGDVLLKAHMPAWRKWLRVYIAGGSASEWAGSRPNEGAQDLDVLIGADYESARSHSPVLAGMTDEQVDSALNSILRGDFNEQGWQPPFGGRWDVTAYVNPRAWDIRDIKPYAAWNLTNSDWAVRPPHLPEHAVADFGPAVLAHARAVTAEARAILRMPEPLRSREARDLWEHVHQHRCVAFSEAGDGWQDPGNIDEKWLAYAPGDVLGRIRELALTSQPLASPVARAAGYYHGTRYSLNAGDVLEGGSKPANNPGSPRYEHVYMTRSPAGAHAAGSHSYDERGSRQGATNVYEVEPIDPPERDPFTEGAVRSRRVRVIRQVSPQNPPCDRCGEPLRDEDVEYGASEHLGCEGRRTAGVAVDTASIANMGTMGTEGKTGALEATDYEGDVGNRAHITRNEHGTVPLAAILHLRGKEGEVPGEHRNRQGADWEAFKADVASGLRSPIFITVDHGKDPVISEGSHRRDALAELGAAEAPVHVRYYGHAEQQGTLLGRMARTAAHVPEDEPVVRTTADLGWGDEEWASARREPWHAAAQLAQQEVRMSHPRLTMEFPRGEEGDRMVGHILRHAGYPPELTGDAFVSRHPNPAAKTSNPAWLNGKPGVTLHPDRWDYGTVAHESAHHVVMYRHAVASNEWQPDEQVHGPEWAAAYGHALSKISRNAGEDFVHHHQRFRDMIDEGLQWKRPRDLDEAERHLPPPHGSPWRREAMTGYEGITGRTAMIYLDLPEDAVHHLEGGVDDHHITLVYLGKNVSDAAFEEAKRRAAKAAAECEPLSGFLRGVETFPSSGSSDQKVPAFVPAYVPGIGRLRGLLEDLSASEFRQYRPHVTLAYLEPGDDLPAPHPVVPVHFSRLHVKRGDDIVSFPLGDRL